MKEVLFLCHRLPYPPNKGDKIRSFHLLKMLARHYRVHLGAFIDDPADTAHANAVDEWTDQRCLLRLRPRLARLRSLASLLRGEALSFAYYRNRAMQRWVDRIMRERPIHAVVVFSSGMGPYAQGFHDVRRVIDFVDVDSEKWREYADRGQGALRWLYAREGRCLLAGERALASAFDASVFVSAAEADLFRLRAPECAPRVDAISNGVDSDYFDPAREYPDPYAGRGDQQMVFTGVMDYAANVDAVTWFCQKVWPLIRARHSSATFTIVGARPARAVLDLGRQPGVEVTGSVPDVRPYLAHARLSIAPMRIARGVQNKVLEALAMGNPVVMTPQAATGLCPTATTFAQVASAADEFAGHALAYLSAAPGDESARVARDYAIAHYSWDAQLAGFVRLVAGDDISMRPADPAEHAHPGALACVSPS